MAIFYCLRFETPTTWMSRFPYLYFPGTGWPTYTSGTGFPFRRLLRLAGLRWMYSNPLPHCNAKCLQDKSSAWITQKIHHLYCRRYVFITSLHSNGGGADHIENIAFLLSRALPSNGRCLSRHCSATELYATLRKGAIKLLCLWL
jgi:hypothetical protein